VTDGQQKVNDENVDNNGGDEKVWGKFIKIDGLWFT
jgi:hypothetical protein